MSIADDNGPEPGRDEMIAAEYVLGVLPAAEREAAARRIDAEPRFARLVDQWEVRLSPMAEAYSEAEPPASVKAAIDRRLYAGNRVQAGGVSWWSSLALWRGLAIASLAALALYVAVPYLSPQAEVSSERYVASLAPNESDVHYFVIYDARSQDVGLSHVTGARPEGRDFELWVIEGSNPPQSLGVIPEGQRVHLAVADAVLDKIEAGAQLAISLEPAGGSPTGQPTGPVVAAGDLNSI
ncbi:anti-sigma factor [Mesorhizobium sp. L-2-11]|uniref:anti-sigma factor n=1 Tax=Mesorhizobium sp. L-2-11 TaxID=2744521 RepID=UPI001926197E|nr:anti-sigma factor [Mesorhizobium sp. L-2-11]BCH19714.1 anti-sigma K factor RskA [Mesorhizobium sp. L-2-11]